MSIVAALGLGVIQGVTEFLPISSSGHLILARLVLSLPEIDPLVFDTLLHAGTLIAVLVALWPDVARLGRSLGDWVRRRPNPDAAVVSRIIVACLPAVLVGVLFENTIETTFRSTHVVIAMLALIAFVFLWIERRPDGGRAMTSLSWRDALLIGMLQTLAFIPGVSRSGITIVGGLLLGLRHQAAARFSFLLSIPVISGAVISQSLKLAEQGTTGNVWEMMIAGLVASAVAGVVSIRYFLRFMARGSLRPFAVYRLALAAALLIAVAFGVVP